MKKIQNTRGDTDDSSDMIGIQVPVIDDITETVGTSGASIANVNEYSARLIFNTSAVLTAGQGVQGRGNNATTTSILVDSRH